MKLNRSNSAETLEMRTQREISRCTSHANRSQGYTCDNSCGTLQTNLGETPAIRTRQKVRATRSRNGHSRHLKLAAAGILCITFILLVPHVGQEKHRVRKNISGCRILLAAGESKTNEDNSWLNPLEMAPKKKSDDVTIWNITEYLLKKRKERGPDFKKKLLLGGSYITQLSWKIDQSAYKKAQEEREELFTALKAGFLTTKAGKQCHPEARTSADDEEEWNELWNKAIELYTEIEESNLCTGPHTPYYVVKQYDGNDGYKFESNGMSGFYVKDRTECGQTYVTYVQKRFVNTGAPAHKLKEHDGSPGAYKNNSGKKTYRLTNAHARKEISRSSKKLAEAGGGFWSNKPWGFREKINPCPDCSGKGRSSIFKMRRRCNKCSGSGELSTVLPYKVYARMIRR